MQVFSVLTLLLFAKALAAENLVFSSSSGCLEVSEKDHMGKDQKFQVKVCENSLPQKFTYDTKSKLLKHGNKFVCLDEGQLKLEGEDDDCQWTYSEKDQTLKYDSEERCLQGPDDIDAAVVAATCNEKLPSQKITMKDYSYEDVLGIHEIDLEALYEDFESRNIRSVRSNGNCLDAGLGMENSDLKVKPCNGDDPKQRFTMQDNLLFSDSSQLYVAVNPASMKLMQVDMEEFKDEIRWIYDSESQKFRYYAKPSYCLSIKPAQASLQVCSEESEFQIIEVVDVPKSEESVNYVLYIGIAVPVVLLLVGGIWYALHLRKRNAMIDSQFFADQNLGENLAGWFSEQKAVAAAADNDDDGAPNGELETVVVSSQSSMKEEESQPPSKSNVIDQSPAAEDQQVAENLSKSSDDKDDVLNMY